MTTQPKPPAVRPPALEPVPVEGCRIRVAASNGREAARGRGDTGGARRYGDMIEEHPHRRGTEAEVRT